VECKKKILLEIKIDEQEKNQSENIMEEKINLNKINFNRKEVKCFQIKLSLPSLY